MCVTDSKRDDSISSACIFNSLSFFALHYLLFFFSFVSLSRSLPFSLILLWIFIQAILPHPTAYFFATGGGYDKLEVYKCSDGVKTPAVTREMLIRFPNGMLSWRHQQIHMVIQLLHTN